MKKKLPQDFKFPPGIAPSLIALLLASCGQIGKTNPAARSQSVASEDAKADAGPQMTIEDIVQGFENPDELEDQVVSDEDRANWEKSLVDESTLKPTDAQLTATSFQLDDIPADQREVIDLRANDTGIRNQGSEGTCTAFATVASIENLIKRFYGQSIDISERHHWTTYGDYQTTSSLRVASSAPIVAEATWPYYGRRPSSLSGQGLAKLNSYTTTQLALEPVVASLRKGQPVVIAVGVLSSMMNPKQGGIITGGSQQGRSGHALAVTGAIIDSRVPGGGYFILKNSWGTSWGDKGYGYASFDYCQRTWCSAYSVADASLYSNGAVVPKPNAVPDPQPSSTVVPTPAPTAEPDVTPTPQPSVTPAVDPSPSITAEDFKLIGHPSNRRGLFGKTSFYLSVEAKQDVLKKIRYIQYAPSAGRRYTVYNGAAADVEVRTANLASPDFKTFSRSFQTEDVVVKLRSGETITLRGISVDL